MARLLDPDSRGLAGLQTGWEIIESPLLRGGLGDPTPSRLSAANLAEDSVSLCRTVGMAIAIDRPVLII